MKSRFVSTALVAAGLLFFAAGCQKSADQQSATDNSASSQPDGSSGSGGSSGGKSSGSSSAARKVEPPPVVVPADTPIAVVLDQTISTKTAENGQAFSATVEAPVEIDAKTAIPKGARASGIIKDAKAAGRFKGGAVLELTLTSVTVEGKSYDITTSAPTLTSKGKGKRTAAMVGGGGAGGALIGGLAGGGKGALIGALAGAAAGTGGAAFTGNRDITLAAETPLTFKLKDALTLKR